MTELEKREIERMALTMLNISNAVFFDALMERKLLDYQDIHDAIGRIRDAQPRGVIHPILKTVLYEMEMNLQPGRREDPNLVRMIRSHSHRLFADLEVYPVSGDGNAADGFFGMKSADDRLAALFVRRSSKVISLAPQTAAFSATSRRASGNLFR